MNKAKANVLNFKSRVVPGKLSFKKNSILIQNYENSRSFRTFSDNSTHKNVQNWLTTSSVSSLFLKENREDEVNSDATTESIHDGHSSSWEDFSPPPLKIRVLEIDEEQKNKDENNYDFIWIHSPPPSSSKEYFSKLPDEMILKILKWLPKVVLGRIAQTCTKFEKLTKDESLWKRIDVIGKIIYPMNTIEIMSRKPVFLRMAGATIREPTGLYSGLLAPQMTYLDLSWITIDSTSLVNLLGMCAFLQKLSLEQLNINSETLKAMSVFARSINTLNFTMCTGLEAEPLSNFLSMCPKLNSLNLGCIVQTWTSEDLSLVINHIPICMNFLNLAGFKTKMINEHVQVLTSRCPYIIDLDLSDCQKITGCIISMLIHLNELQHLCLSRCYSLDPQDLKYLESMTNLKYLEIFHFNDDSFCLKTTLPNIIINQFQFSSVARPTVGIKRNTIWNQRVKF